MVRSVLWLLRLLRGLRVPMVRWGRQHPKVLSPPRSQQRPLVRWGQKVQMVQ